MPYALKGMEMANNDLKPNKIEEAYDSPHWWYDIRGFFILTFSYNSSLWKQVAFFAENISKSHLEVAIGSGTLFSMILGWRRWKGLPAGRVAGVDYAAPMLAGARKRFGGNPDIQILREDVCRMTFENESFESVNVANAIHCFEDVDGALREIKRVMRPGGSLRFNALLYPRHGVLGTIAGLINRWGSKKGILHKPFTVEEVVTALRQAGFELKSAALAGNSLNVVAQKPAAGKTEAPPAAEGPRQEVFDLQALSRNAGILTVADMEILRHARVAIPGMGGAGGHHLLTLTRAGIGHFTISDFDRFELANFNRQAGAKIKNIGRPKIDVMEEEALEINPYLDVRRFPGGINESNIDAFLDDVDVVVDGLDAFAIHIRRRLFNRARERGIPVVTAGPMGFGAALLVFTPKGMGFDDYFDIRDGMSDLDMLLAFFTGLSPRLPHMRYIDPATVDIEGRRGPSLGLACGLCAGVAATEVVRCLTRPSTVKAAPYFSTFDPYLRRLYQGRLRWGNRSPLRRLARGIAVRRFNRLRRHAAQDQE